MFLEEIRDGLQIDIILHGRGQYNYFYSKKRLMQDMWKALKIRSLAHAQNAQTFHLMIIGFISIGWIYVEFTMGWHGNSCLCRLNEILSENLLNPFAIWRIFIVQIKSLIWWRKEHVHCQVLDSLLESTIEHFIRGRLPKSRQNLAFTYRS